MQIRAAAKEFSEKKIPLDCLINNAGLAMEKRLTVDGFEVVLGTNYLGHFLLTVLLMSHIRRAAQETGDARIVHVSSKLHARARKIDWSMFHRPICSLTGSSEYATSKLCNVVFANELARRLDGTNITSNSLHPGVVASSIWRRVPGIFRYIAMRFMITTEEGARTQVYLATSPEVKGRTGKYFDSCKELKPNPAALDASLAKELWDRSVEWTKLTPDELLQADLLQ